MKMEGILHRSPDRGEINGTLDIDSIDKNDITFLGFILALSTILISVVILILLLPYTILHYLIEVLSNFSNYMSNAI